MSNPAVAHAPGWRSVGGRPSWMVQPKAPPAWIAAAPTREAFEARERLADEVGAAAECDSEQACALITKVLPVIAKLPAEDRLAAQTAVSLRDVGAQLKALSVAGADLHGRLHRQCRTLALALAAKAVTKPGELRDAAAAVLSTSHTEAFTNE